MWQSHFIHSAPDIMSGQPCLKGTRIPVGQLVLEIAEESLYTVADDRGLNPEHLRGMINEIAFLFSIPRKNNTAIDLTNKVGKLMGQIRTANICSSTPKVWQSWIRKLLEPLVKNNSLKNAQKKNHDT